MAWSGYPVKMGVMERLQMYKKKMVEAEEEIKKQYRV